MLVSGVAFSKSVQAAILDRWVARSFELVLSSSLIIEMRTALEKEFFVTRFPLGFEGDVSRALRRAELTPLSAIVNGIASHPEDDLVLATALSGKADSLVTGDKQLLRLGRIEGVLIIDSRAFLDILARQDAD